MASVSFVTERLEVPSLFSVMDTPSIAPLDAVRAAGHREAVDGELGVLRRLEHLSPDTGPVGRRGKWRSRHRDPVRGAGGGALQDEAVAGAVVDDARLGVVRGGVDRGRQLVQRRRLGDRHGHRVAASHREAEIAASGSHHRVPDATADEAARYAWASLLTTTV
jgi:hypothetical protein